MKFGTSVDDIDSANTINFFSFKLCQYLTFMTLHNLSLASLTTTILLTLYHFKIASTRDVHVHVWKV